MIVVTPWYCKSFSVKSDGVFMTVRFELIRPVRWFVMAVEGAKWIWGKVKRALR